MFSNDELNGFGRNLDNKHFRLGFFNSASKLEGFGKKVRIDDNRSYEGLFKNDNLLLDTPSSASELR